jgi:hypothetical protein
MRAPVNLAAAVLAAGAVLLGAPAPAVAQEGSMAFERRDAPAGIDMTRLSVDNGEHRFSMHLLVRDLGTAGVFTFYYWGGVHQSPPGRSLLINVTSVEGDARAKFYVCGRDDCVRAKCQGLRARWDAAADFLSVSAPQRCYPRRGPDPVPPKTGRFSTEGRIGRVYDYGKAEPLLLTRG